MNLSYPIYDLIEEKIKKLKTPSVVGIDGSYASGKTNFTVQLATHLRKNGYDIQVIHYDDFHKPLPSITWSQEKNSEVDAFYHAFNSQKLLDELLIPLKQEGVLNKTIKGLDWVSATYANDRMITIGERTIVLLEGSLLFREKLLSFIDYKIFLEVSMEEVMRRGRERDVPKFGEWIMDKYRTRYIPVYQRHLNQNHVREIADLVIDNNDYNHPSIK
ncbi:MULTISPECIES: uridine kinase family protein [Enterococcus]|uniref:uridine kinase family protein n=1 Tax=Enterococcus TaxID=1350 RepID=UPI00372CF007